MLRRICAKARPTASTPSVAVMTRFLRLRDTIESAHASLPVWDIPTQYVTIKRPQVRRRCSDSPVWGFYIDFGFPSYSIKGEWLTSANF